METIVKIRDLLFTRQDRAIFNGVDLDFKKGKITAILGPSGTGKTTLLRLIGAQLYPDKGTIEVSGQNIHKLTRKKLFEARRDIGMLFQSSALFTNLNVYENVAFPLRVHTQFKEPLIHDLVLMKLEAVGLRGAKNLQTSELSGGMARRVALARAAILDPQLIMYDEPFTGLDPIAKGVIVKLIREFNDALGITSVLVSHDVAEAIHIADFVYVISGGKVIGQGKPDEIMQNPNSDVQQFLQGLPDGAVSFHYPAVDYESELFDSDDKR
jgi:phospholipid/cholesterol/gamma-HCH transport system ATP-binding protein